MANVNSYYLIGFDRLENLPEFVHARFDTYDEAGDYFEMHENELTEKYWTIQIYQMDNARNFIEL